jgi:hypothetical protein
MFSVQATQETEQIGGVGIEVQIDESKFGKRKYHRGHAVQGSWVFGGVEILYSENGKAYAGRCIAFAVVDRTRETLFPILQKYVAAGSHISSDGWTPYRTIDKIRTQDGSLAFTHGVVVHERHFKDPVTGTHTNVIEGLWRWMKNAVPHRFYYDGDKVQTCLYKYMWDREAKGERWKRFMTDLRDLRFDKK